MQQGLNLCLQGERPAPKPINHKDLLIMSAWFFDLAELAKYEFWWNFSDIPRRRLWSMQAVFVNLVPQTSRFFFNSGPKKGAFSLTGCKMWSAKPWKNDISNYGINLKNIIQHSPITILPIMFLAGEFPHKIEAVFLLGLRGFLWVWIMGTWNVMGSGYGSNISVDIFIYSQNFKN